MEAADGRYRVSYIYRDGPADKEWLDIAKGDYVLAINGQELKSGDNYERLMATDDVSEGVAAFFERRAPKFQGR